MFKNMKLGMKVFSGLILLTLLLVVVGIIGTVNIHKISEADSKLYEQMTVPVSEMGVIGMSFHRIRVNLRDAVASNDQSSSEKFITRVDELTGVIDKNVEYYEKTLFSAEGKKSFGELKNALTEYKKSQVVIADHIKKGNKSEAQAILYGEGGAAARKVIELIDVNYDMKLKFAKETADSNTVLANSSTRMMYIIIVVAAIFAIGLGYFITKNIKSIITTLLDEAKRLVDAAVNGKLDTRADPEKINFEFRDIVVGVNNTLDAVIGPLNVAAEYVDRISHGDIPPKITDTYHGDFNEIKNNLNQCIDAVSLLVLDANMLSKAAVEGRLDTRADATKHQGDFAAIVKGVKTLLML